jgi:hypothetical protein
MPSDYPHLFDNIGFLTRTTQMYTQRRQDVELPENYKWTVEELAAFFVTEFEMVTADQLYYLHSQGTPSTVWNITHNLNRPVQIRCKDESDDGMVGEISDDSMNTSSVLFTVAVQGVALCT